MMYGMSPLLPAEMTLDDSEVHHVGEHLAGVVFALPKEPPIDMLITSTALFNVPEPVGSSAKSIPSRIATPLQAVETELHTFTAYNCAPGAVPK